MNNLLSAIMTKLSYMYASYLADGSHIADGSIHAGSDRDITELYNDVGGRIFLDTAPEGTEFPYVAFFIVSGVPEYPSNKIMEDIIMQFSLFSASQGAAEITTMHKDLKTILDDCTLSITDSTLIYFIRGNLSTMVEEITTQSGVATVKHWAQDYSIMKVYD